MFKKIKKNLLKIKGKFSQIQNRHRDQYKKILVVVKGWVDLDRLEALIDTSIEKYPEFILKETND